SIFTSEQYTRRASPSLQHEYFVGPCNISIGRGSRRSLTYLVSHTSWVDGSSSTLGCLIAGKSARSTLLSISSAFCRSNCRPKFHSPPHDEQRSPPTGQPFEDWFFGGESSTA